MWRMAALAEPVGLMEQVSPSGRPRPVWLALLLFCLWRGLAVGLAFSILLAVATATLADGEVRRAPRADFHPQSEAGPHTFSGMVTDSNCRARHNKNSNLSSTECAELCIRGGAKYVLVDGEKVFFLEGHPRQLAKLAGQRAEVHGTLTGETIQVDSIFPQ